MDNKDRLAALAALPVSEKNAIIEKAKEYARELKQAGYHCSESVIRAVPKALGLDISDEIIKAACAFFGGGGGTGGRCGVVESGIILISMIYGRADNTVSEFDAKVIATALIRRYKAQIGTDVCGVIKPKEVANFGSAFGCQRIYEEGSAIVTKLLLDSPRLLEETDPQRFAIKLTEDALVDLFGPYEAVTENFIRHRDDALCDMYDLNYFEYDEVPGEDEIQAVFDFQKRKGDTFVKIEGRKPLPTEISEKFGLETWQELTMVLTDGDPSLWTKNTKLEIKDLHSELLSFQSNKDSACRQFAGGTNAPAGNELSPCQLERDLYDLEMRNFGSVYGEDFTSRKMLHWLDAAKKSKLLNFYGAYTDGKLIGSLFTFKGKDYVAVDGLIVDPSARKQYAATTLLSAAIQKEGGIAFLHAESDDTPKEMYAKLGFTVADTKYCACKTDGI